MLPNVHDSDVDGETVVAFLFHAFLIEGSPGRRPEASPEVSLMVWDRGLTGT